MKINIGCGPDIKEGWTNTDNFAWEGSEYWDITEHAPYPWYGKYDFALVNHTLCLLSYDDVDKALLNIKDVLKPGGVLEVIDMDTMLAFQNLEKHLWDAWPGFEGSAQERLCKHLVGYGRKSLWTTYTMLDHLEKAGFTNLKGYVKSENDIRPLESLVVQGTK